MENSYAAPQSIIPQRQVPGTEAEQVRNKHLSHEVAVRSVANLYYTGAIFIALGLICFLIVGHAALDAGYMDSDALVGVALLCLFFIVIFWRLGNGLQHLRPWVRIPIILLTAAGFLNFPVGMIIYCYPLYLMISRKSTMVFSPGYLRVIEETPHIHYRSSALKAGMVLILVLCVLVELFSHLENSP